MNRRTLLQGLTAIGAATPLASLAQGTVAPAWTVGFNNMNQTSLNTPALRLRGKLPNALRGTFYRNGPSLNERAGLRYKHWFDGDGMVHAYRFGDKGISHQAEFVRTAKFAAEEKAGQFLVDAFGTVVPNALAPSSADSVNVANTTLQTRAYFTMACGYKRHAIFSPPQGCARRYALELWDRNRPKLACALQNFSARRAGKSAGITDSAIAHCARLRSDAAQANFSLAAFSPRFSSP